MVCRGHSVVAVPLAVAFPEDVWFALSMKIVGVLLMTALLIIPAATARRLTLGPERMAVFAPLIGALAVMGGLSASLRWDTPSGPSIVVAAMLLFLATLSPGFSALIRRQPQ